MSSKYLYGIDLGTTNSCIAYLNGEGKPEVIPNKENSRTTPSVVSLINGIENPVVGEVAKDNAVFDAEYTIAYVKNKIGRKDEDGNELMCIYGPDAESEISPVKVSSMILSKLVQDASEHMGEPVENVVITVPAYFPTALRVATKKAGEDIGLNVLDIIEEPTAAAICYGCSKDVDGKRFLVYDLGGGTFDITVMEVKEGRFEVVCSEGDHDLGGGRWDKSLYDYLLDKYREETGDEEELSLDSEQDLISKSEKYKKQLSELEVVKVPIRTENDRAKIEVTRDKFDEITSVLLEETINLTKKAIAVSQGFAMGDAGEKDISTILEEFSDKYDASKIDTILLVGGSTKMPQIKERVEKEFGVQTVSFDPDEAVAKGASIMAKIRQIPIPEPGVETGNGVKKPPVDIGTGSKLPPVLENSNVKDIIVRKNHKSYGIVVSYHDKPELEPDGYEVISNLIMRDSKLPLINRNTYSVSEGAAIHHNIALRLCEHDSRDEKILYDRKYEIFAQEVGIPEEAEEGTPITVEMELLESGIFNVYLEILGKRIELEALYGTDKICNE